jgi:hypothetical protein
MTQRELELAIARATGESPRTIRELGFGPLHAIAYEVERPPLVVDWDELDQRRHRPAERAAR